MNNKIKNEILITCDFKKGLPAARAVCPPGPSAAGFCVFGLGANTKQCYQLKKRKIVTGQVQWGNNLGLHRPRLLKICWGVNMKINLKACVGEDPRDHYPHSPAAITKGAESVVGFEINADETLKISNIWIMSILKKPILVTKKYFFGGSNTPNSMHRYANIDRFRMN